MPLIRVCVRAKDLDDLQKKGIETLVAHKGSHESMNSFRQLWKHGNMERIWVRLR